VNKLVDRLAARAARRGRSSGELRDSARNLLNGTWFFLVVACFVAYIFGPALAIVPGALVLITATRGAARAYIASRLEKRENAI
jgi:hypothetical protein